MLMTKKEKAKLILDNLEEIININYNFEDIYMKQIVKGHVEIERAEEN